jgi:hypothetical protein
MLRSALLLPLLPLLLAAAPPKKGAGHPEVGPNDAPDACETCHANATPAAVRAWEGSTHGLLLVKCVACHGSAGADFAKAPGPSRCQGCHAEQVASVAPAKGKKGSACFSCHVPHTLLAEGRPNPHAR